MPIKTLSATDLDKWIDSNLVAVVDVRPREAFIEGHIEGATNIPLTEVTLDKVLPLAEGGKKLVMNCFIGKSSMTACEKVLIEDDIEIWSLEGGIEAWKKAGLPLEAAT